MIIQDAAQDKLDKAARLYRRRYNFAYNLSEQGQDVRAKALLDKANAEYEAAKQEFRRARGHE